MPLPHRIPPATTVLSLFPAPSPIDRLRDRVAAGKRFISVGAWEKFKALGLPQQARPQVEELIRDYRRRALKLSNEKQADVREQFKEAMILTAKLKVALSNIDETMTARDALLSVDGPSIAAPDFSVTILKARRELDRLLPVLALAHMDLKPRRGAPSLLRVLVSDLDTLFLGFGVRLRRNGYELRWKRRTAADACLDCVKFVVEAAGIVAETASIEDALKDAIGGRKRNGGESRQK